MAIGCPDRPHRAAATGGRLFLVPPKGDPVSSQSCLMSRRLSQLTAFLIPGSTIGLTPNVPSSTVCTKFTSLLGM